MQFQEAKLLLEAVSTTLPLAILLVEDEADRQFLADLYLQYRGLIYKSAANYFSGNLLEIEDAVSSTAERMCKYCKELKQIPCNKQKCYLVKMVRTVCIARLAELRHSRERNDWFADSQVVEGIADEAQAHDFVFSRVYAEDLLDSFSALSDRDKELIRMRHIDMMAYDDIARALNISERAARTAISRAKKRLEKLALHVKDDNL